jgi:predicted tellurium resistance membrane protein TerC
LLGDHHEGEGEAKEYGSLMAAVRTILIADLVMSLDNVIAVAAAAKGSTTLLILGLAISIPLVIFGSTLMIRLMERFPIVVTFGAGLIGWVGGETMISDNVLVSTVEGAHWLHYAGPVLGAAAVLGAGTLLARRHAQADPTAP